MTHRNRGKGRTRVRPRHIAATIIVVSFFSLPAGAQNDADITRLEALKAQRETVLDESIDSLDEIDAATSSVEEIADAVDRLNAYVLFREGRFEDAKRSLESAEAAVETARQTQRSISVEISTLREHVADLAVSSFTGESALDSGDLTELALSDDPGEAARIRHLLRVQTGTLSDSVDRLRGLEIEAENLLAAEAAAAADAAAALSLVDERALTLRTAADQQRIFLLAAETRLEARLAEAAVLEERDEELAVEIRRQQQSINIRFAAIAREKGVEIPRPVDLDDILSIVFPEFEIDFSIEVNSAIADATEALFLEAFEQGIDLAGWGYRPIQLQIELRATNCGNSDEAIWQTAAFDCAPPTARPGFSKHEQGLAIDFTWGGAMIATVDNPGFVWLRNNAPKYGFVNLEGEPWHWSLGG